MWFVPKFSNYPIIFSFHNSIFSLSFNTHCPRSMGEISYGFIRHVYDLSIDFKVKGCKVTSLAPTSQYRPHLKEMSQCSSEVCYHFDVGNRISNWYRDWGPLKALQIKLCFAIFTVHNWKSIENPFHPWFQREDFIIASADHQKQEHEVAAYWMFSYCTIFLGCIETITDLAF